MAMTLICPSNWVCFSAQLSFSGPKGRKLGSFGTDEYTVTAQTCRNDSPDFSWVAMACTVPITIRYPYEVIRDGGFVMFALIHDCVCCSQYKEGDGMSSEIPSGNCLLEIPSLLV